MTSVALVRPHEKNWQSHKFLCK